MYEITGSAGPTVQSIVAVSNITGTVAMIDAVPVPAVVGVPTSCPVADVIEQPTGRPVAAELRIFVHVVGFTVMAVRRVNVRGVVYAQTDGIIVSIAATAPLADSQTAVELTSVSDICAPPAMCHALNARPVDAEYEIAVEAAESTK